MKLFVVPLVAALSLTASHTALSSSMRAIEKVDMSQPKAANALYVAPKGSDMNDGAYQTPFATIEAAVNAAKAGDVVYVSGGVHVLQKGQDLSNSGTATDNIVIKPLNVNDPVIIDASALSISKAPALSISGAHITIDNLHILGASGDAVHVAGDHVTLSNNVFADASDAAVRLADGVTHTTLKGNEIKNSASGEGAILAKNARNLKVLENHIYNNKTALSLDATENVIVENNIINDNSVQHVLLNDVSNLRIVNNEIFSSNDVDAVAALTVSSDTKYYTVADNMMHNIASVLVQEDGKTGKADALQNIVIKNNTFYNVVDTALKTHSPVTGSNDVQFANNITHQQSSDIASDAAYNNNCFSGQLPKGVSGRNNVVASVNLQDNEKPVSINNIVVDASCSLAGAKAFETLEFADSSVTLPQKEITAVASAADILPEMGVLSDVQTVQRDFILQDDRVLNNMVSSNQTNNASDRNVIPENLMNNQTMMAMIRDIITSIVTNIMSSIFSGQGFNTPAAESFAPPPVSSPATTTQAVASNNSVERVMPPQPSAARVQEASKPESVAAPTKTSSPQKKSAPSTVDASSSQPARNISGEGAVKSASASAAPASDDSNSNVSVNTSNVQTENNTPSERKMPSEKNVASADDVTTEVASNESSTKNNGVTAAPVEETVNDVAIAQNTTMQESNIFIPSAKNAAITNDFVCNFDMAAKEAAAKNDPLTDCTVNDWRGEPTVGELKSPAWGSGSYAGKTCRTLSSDGTMLTVDFKIDAGGYDTAIQSFSKELGTTETKVDDVPASLKVTSSYSMQMEGDGFDWYVLGPKVGIWPCTSEQECPDTFWPEWYENYIVEYSDKSPEEMHESKIKSYVPGKENKYLGETTHEGSTYKHYLVHHAEWKQMWSIRQDYRLAGTVGIKHFLDVWRKAGMPNYYVQKVKANFESGGKGCAQLKIKDALISKVY